MPKNILVTGASGFIGRNYKSNATYKSNIVSVSLQNTKLEEIDLTNINSIVHLAGIAHRMNQPSGQIYYDINSTLTTNLALKAKKSGVKQFVFISTIKVYGDKEGFDINFEEDSLCLPNDDYGKSKREAEQSLLKLSDSKFKVAIVRPSLVYGAGVKGNLEKLMKLVSKKYKLPFGNINNKRSMVYVGNLIALIDTIIKQKAEGVFIAGDKQPISTSYLIQNIQKNFGQKKHLFSLPGLFRNLIKTLKPELYKRLFCSLVVDNSITNQKLNFIPPFDSEIGIREMVLAYQENL